MTKLERRRLEAAVRELVKSEIENSWKGGGNPAYIPIIEGTVKAARDRFRKLLDRMEDKP